MRYTPEGMTALLRRLGSVDKKAKLVPGKAGAARQEAFAEDYRKLMENSEEGDAILFSDATHPLHNPA